MWSVLIFLRLLKMRLGEILAYKCLHTFIAFLYNGLVIEYFSLSGKIPLVITLLHI
jgi:hypothetical protein